MGTNSLSTYTSTYIDLTADLSPFTITQTGTISTGNTHAAVYSAIAAPSLSNAGIIIDTLATGVGVKFMDGGAIFNSGTIEGFDAIAISGASGTVVNDGSILAPYSGYVIGLFSGGYVSNASGASMYVRASQAIIIAGGTGTVVNDGTIEAAGNVAINLEGGGYVSNAAGATIYGGEYGILVGATTLNGETLTNGGKVVNAGTVVNDGTIESNKYGAGIYLRSGGGDVTNAAGATIYGGYDGVGIFNAPGTVVNYGNISGDDDRFNGGIGVGLFGGGNFTNATGAQVYGYQHGVEIAQATGTIINSGNIEGRLQGVYILSSGSVINTASGSIYGGNDGIVMKGDGTVTNAGTIGMTGTAFSVARPPVPYPNPAPPTPPFSSSSRPAINFESSGTNRLIVDPGAVFIGAVEANTAASNTLELASGSSAGTLTGVGSQFTGFGTIDLDTGAQWTLGGNTVGLASGETITGFVAGDTIDIAGLTLTSNETLSLGAGGVLSIPGTTDTLTFTGISDLESFTLSSDGAGGTDITDALCYLRGTRILTPTGEMPVEELRIGDLLVSCFGAIQPIKWIGRQFYDSRFVRNNSAKIPVRIKAGALGAQTPARDLFVSPGHSVLLNGTLILASTLVNGITITQASDKLPARIEYFQIEFDTHDCVIAEGAWSETYADAPGLRAQFHNAAEFYDLYPDQAPPEELCLCAPRPERGEKLGAALRSVVARAATGLTAGPFEGYIDSVAEWRIEGWALDHDYPELPILLEILLGERVIGTVLACDYRADLLEAGISNGNRAFFHASPVRIPIESWADLRVRRACDGTLLQMTPACRERIAQTQPTHIPALLRAVG
jgi:hypothetical protein